MIYCAMSEPEQKGMFLTSSDYIFRWKFVNWSYFQKLKVCDWQPHTGRTLCSSAVFIRCVVSRSCSTLT